MAMRQAIEPPRAREPDNGILVSAERPVDQVRWQQGFRYDPEGCVTGKTYDPCGTPGITVPDNPADREWEPYALSFSYKCSTMGNAEDLERIRARVERGLLHDQERQIGFELWTGTQAQASGWPNKWLASGNANVDLLNGGNVEDALACLEDYLNKTNSGAPGMIHATAQVVTRWAQYGMVQRNGSRIFTVMGTRVVASPGYLGTNPSGTIGVGNIWAYATDLVEVRLDEIEYRGLGPGELDRATNTVTARAQRVAVASWEGCRLAAAPLNLTPCGISGS